MSQALARLRKKSRRALSLCLQAQIQQVLTPGALPNASMVSLNENIMEIKEITEKKEWEDFIQSVKPHTFLESWQWGEFNRAMGDRAWRLGLYDNSQLTTY